MLDELNAAVREEGLDETVVCMGDMIYASNPETSWVLKYDVFNIVDSDGLELTPEQHERKLVQLRVSVEHWIGRLLSLWGRLDEPPRQKRIAYTTPHATLAVAVTLTNLHTAFNGSIVSRTFGGEHISVDQLMRFRERNMADEEDYEPTAARDGVDPYRLRKIEWMAERSDRLSHSSGTSSDDDVSSMDT